VGLTKEVGGRGMTSDWTYLGSSSLLVATTDGRRPSQEYLVVVRDEAMRGRERG